MIRVGLGEEEKRAEIARYLTSHEIKKVFAFFPDMFPLPALDIPETIYVEHVEYKNIIMYEYFYRLLEVIDPKTLLVFNECMRTQNRNDLTYNCAHHYCNQTGHKIIFEYLPFINEVDNFMILLDFQSKGKYKGKSFDYRYLAEEDVRIKPHHFTVEDIAIPPLEERDIQKYQRKKEQLFDGLGNSDPDTIPRQLHVFAGNFKKPYIQSNLLYVARNDRFKLPNVKTYKEARPGEHYVIIDFPHRRLDFNDFLKITGMEDIRFLSSGLKVDMYYLGEAKSWVRRLDEFYAQAGVC